ncbi:unnamed protein product [Calypogeia fissa]
MGIDHDFVPDVALVTGGRGFAARHMVLQLLEKTEYVVRIMDLAPEINLSEEEKAGALGKAVQDGRVHYVQADLRDPAKVQKALEGVTTVFHMAAPDSSINKFKIHYDVTVIGTRNIVDACIKQGVKKLIYTSSPSVIFDGFEPVVNVDESFRIPEKHNDFYSEAKAQAEALVLSSNGKNGLLTCAIRPSGIFGPGDRLAVPSAIAAAKAGKLKFFIGNGENMFDWTYVENVANAHLCADNSLVPGEVEGENVAAGKAYFITNGEPIRFWEFFVLVLEGLGYPGPKYGLPVPLLMPFAYIVDWTCKQLAPYGVKPSQFTPTRLRIMSTTRTFNIKRANKLLGYVPPVPLMEGIKRTVDSFAHLRNDKAVKSKDTSQKTSKMRVLLGDETVADVILWTDAKQTLTALSFLSFMAYLFFASGYTMVSLVSKFLFWSLLALFAYSRLPESVFGMELPRIPSFECFEVSEETTEHIALMFRSSWNSVAEVAGKLKKGKDWSLFFKLVSLLRIIKFIGRFSAQTQATLGLLAIFTLPRLYEEYEEEVDQFVADALKTYNQKKKLVLSKLPPAVMKYVK